MKWHCPNSFSPGAPALPSAWWPGAASPSQSQKPPQHGADPQMTGGCSRTLQLPSRTGCPFQSQVHLKARTWWRIVISAKCAIWWKKTETRSGQECILTHNKDDLCIFNFVWNDHKQTGLQVHTMCNIQRLNSQSYILIIFCNKPSRRSDAEELHAVKSAVHVFPIVQLQGTVLPGQLGWCECML